MDNWHTMAKERIEGIEREVHKVELRQAFAGAGRHRIRRIVLRVGRVGGEPRRFTRRPYGVALGPRADG